MTPFKQSSAKRCSGVISTLTRLIDTGSLWCALNAWAENIFGKLDLRRKTMCYSINKAGHGRLRMGNSFMQSLSLKHFLAVKILSVFCRPFSHANLNDPGSRATATTKMELFNQVTLCVGILETKTIVLIAKARALYGV